MKTAIFFDVGQTLVTGMEQSARRILGSRLHLSEKQTRQVGRMIMTHPAEDVKSMAEALAGILPEHDPVHLLSVTEILWQEQTECVREVEGAAQLLESLKTMGFPLGVISNTWHPFYQGFCRNCRDIVDKLDHTVLSYRLGMKKPSVDLFTHAANLADVSTSSCWMIGDSYELDVEPSQKAGMRGIWLLCRPERERSLLAQVIRGDRQGPCWAAENLQDLLPFFQEKYR
jgi:HAD superfamily hydrolase (TIGR01549 family)